jgi:hypothetical protein
VSQASVLKIKPTIFLIQNTFPFNYTVNKGLKKQELPLSDNKPKLFFVTVSSLHSIQTPLVGTQFPTQQLKLKE